ncbi:hypothetical protein AAHA92_24201 [Salvia divinorum]|uniref:Uncharacterized protein n=1 Tax=Salvia divinorum TaxID=28513 RepID=A0ABD1G9B2_SALDI
MKNNIKDPIKGPKEARLASGYLAKCIRSGASFWTTPGTLPDRVKFAHWATQSGSPVCSSGSSIQSGGSPSNTAIREGASLEQRRAAEICLNYT